VPAGDYHCIIDAIVITPVDVTFDLIWRRGNNDMLLSRWNQQFLPTPGSFDAQPYELDVSAPAIDFEDGDLLVFRYSASVGSQPNAWVPNSEGTTANGRIPNFTLPAR
jgi:hypothetical protein